MRTMLIRVRNVPAPQDWPVELCVDNSGPDWTAQPVGHGTFPRVAPPVQLPAAVGGEPLPLDGVVSFLLREPRSAGYLAIGQHLFELLHNSGIGPRWDGLRKQHATGNSGGLRTVLDIQPDALRSLPWETLADPQGRIFSWQPRNPLIRGPIDFQKKLKPFLVPLRILIVVGTDEAELKWSEELDAIRGGLIICQGQVEVEVLLCPTATKLASLHDEFQPHIFHFIGHGKESVSGLGAALQLNKGQDGELTGADVVTRLQTETGRLAILNACRTDRLPEPERAAMRERTWTLAENFRLAGYVAVLGMQADIAAEGSVAFSRHLYRGIAANEPLDVAAAKARANIGADRSDVVGNTMLLRDWVVPSLTASVAPDLVLTRRFGPKQEVVDKIEQSTEFKEVAGFVDRTRVRRDVWGELEANGTSDSKHLLIVLGANDLGKTWLIRHVLRTVALRGRAVHYVTFKGKESCDLRTALEIIRDGSGGSFVSGGLPREARERLTHAIRHVGCGKRPPAFEDGPTVLEDCDRWDPGEFEEVLFDWLRDVIIRAARREPMVLALDQIENVQEAARKQLARLFLRPVARGAIAPVRVIVALRASHLAEDWWPQELNDMATVKSLTEIEEKFEPLAREFVQCLGYDVADAAEIIGAIGKSAKGTWSPSLLETVRDILVKLKLKRVM